MHTRTGLRGEQCPACPWRAAWASHDAPRPPRGAGETYFANSGGSTPHGGDCHSSPRSASIINRISAGTLSTSSLSNTRIRCFSTVFGLMPSTWAV